MLIEPLLEFLCHDCKIEALPQKDKKGVYQLNVNPKTQVSFTDLSPGVFFFSSICPLPKLKSSEALFIYLMKANLLGQATGGGAIGVDEGEKMLTFSLTLSEEIDYPTFKNSLEDFVNYLDFWREEVDRYLKKEIP